MWRSTSTIAYCCLYIDCVLDTRFKTNDSDHTYFLTVCGQAEHSSSPDVGLMQINEKQGKTFIIGRLDDVDLEAVEDKQSNLRILRMVYKNGENYGNACARTQRNAVIYIACNSGSNQVNDQLLFSSLRLVDTLYLETVRMKSST